MISHQVLRRARCGRRIPEKGGFHASKALEQHRSPSTVKRQKSPGCGAYPCSTIGTVTRATPPGASNRCISLAASQGRGTLHSTCVQMKRVEACVGQMRRVHQVADHRDIRAGRDIPDVVFAHLGPARHSAPDNRED